MLSSLVRQEMIVNTKDGNVFKGIIWNKRGFGSGAVVVMRGVTQFMPNKPPVEVDGELLLFVRDISYMQKIT